MVLNSSMPQVGALRDPCDVVVGQLHQVTHDIGRRLESIIGQTVPQARKSAGEENDDEVAEIGGRMHLASHARRSEVFCITSGCLAQ